MAIYKATYGLSADQEDNPYLIAEDEKFKKRKGLVSGAGVNFGASSNNLYLDPDENTDATGKTKANTEEPGTPIAEQPIPSASTPGTGADEYMKQLQDLFQSGSVSDQYKAAILTAIKAQELTTQQAVEQIEYQKGLAEKARTKSNREADLTFSRAINPTGKINQNIRSAGLAGSGWQETSQVGLTNAYQTALNTNSSDYNTAVKELNMAISQAQLSGDIATMQAIQTYAIQLAQQLYQESRDAVADRQWEKSYALQKAAFDLEHAAQMESSGYVDPNWPNYPNRWETEPEEETNPEDSETTASDVEERIKGIWRKGIRGEDFKFYAALFLSENADKLTDKDLEALAITYGIDPNNI